jgi:hypothetical protein
MKKLTTYSELSEKLRMAHATNNIRDLMYNVTYNGVHIYCGEKTIFSTPSWRSFIESILRSFFIYEPHTSTKDRKILPLSDIFVKVYDTKNTLEYKYNIDCNIFDRDNNLLYDRSSYSADVFCRLILSAFKLEDNSKRRRKTKSEYTDF